MSSPSFRRSVSTVLAQLGNEHSANESSDSSTKPKPKHGPIKPRSQLVISDSESEPDSSDNEESDAIAMLRFLAAFKLEDYYPTYLFLLHKIKKNYLKFHLILASKRTKSTWRR